MNQRMLAAVMFTDIMGYTAMMQANENEAIEKRNKFRSVIKDSISKTGGDIIQYYGDGALMIFKSASDAVQCGYLIQSNLQSGLIVDARTGIHIGEIVQDGEGVYGDGVNIAARIEALGVPGAVLFSSKVADELSNKPEFTAKLVGSRELKNVKKPVDIFFLDREPLATVDKEVLGIQEKEKSTKKIAVLPFVNLSSDPENEYFSDGVTEEILNALSEIEGLSVISRTSSFSFKNQQLDVREIGKKLNVDVVLEGSVRRHGNKVRISAKLIDTVDGYQQWSEKFDNQLEDIFEIQDEISIIIANQLRQVLSLEEIRHFSTTRATDNLKAYDNYLKGNYHWNQWTPENIKKAMEFYQLSIDEDPDFALPYLGIAKCGVFLGMTGQMRSEDTYPMAKQAALKAIELSPNTPEAVLAMAIISMFFDRNFASAGKYFDELKDHSFRSSEYYQYRAIYEVMILDYDASKQSLEKALEIDPLSLNLMLQLNIVYEALNQYDKMLQNGLKILEMNKGFRAATEQVGWAYLFMDDYENALVYFKKYHNQTGDPLKGLTSLGFAYGRMGEKEKAFEILEKLKQRKERDKDQSLHVDFAMIYNGLGMTDEMEIELEKALRNNNGIMFILAAKIWEDYRKTEHYKELFNELFIMP